RRSTRRDCQIEGEHENSRNRKQERGLDAGEGRRKERRCREIKRNTGCLPDFAAHGQQRAKPKFPTGGRPESGFQSDQKRRTSQKGRQGSDLPCRRCTEYTGNLSENTSAEV